MDNSLKTMIKAAGLNQRDVAGMLGISGAFLSKMCSREQTVPTRLIRPLARLLKVSVGDILEVALSTKETEPQV